MHLFFLLALFVCSVYTMEDDKLPPMLLQLDEQARAKSDDPSTLTQKEVQVVYWMFNKEKQKPSPDEALNDIRHSLLLEQTVDLNIKLQHLKNCFEQATNPDKKADMLEAMAQCVADKTLSILTVIDKYVTWRSSDRFEFDVKKVKPELWPYYAELLGARAEKQFDDFLTTICITVLKNLAEYTARGSTRAEYQIRIKEYLSMKLMGYATELPADLRRPIALMILHVLDEHTYSSLIVQRICRETMLEAYACLANIPANSKLDARHSSYAARGLKEANEFTRFLNTDEEYCNNELVILKKDRRILHKRAIKAKGFEKEEIHKEIELCNKQIKLFENELEKLPSARQRTDVMTLGFAACLEDEATLEKLKPHLKELPYEKLLEGIGPLYAFFAYLKYCHKTNHSFPPGVVDSLVKKLGPSLSLPARLMRASDLCAKGEYKEAYNDLVILKENRILSLFPAQKQAFIILQSAIAELFLYKLHDALCSLSQVRNLVDNIDLKKKSAVLQVSTYLCLNDTSGALRFIRKHIELIDPENRVFFEMLASMLKAKQLLIYELKEFQEIEPIACPLYDRYYAVYRFNVQNEHQKALEENKQCCEQKEDLAIAHLAWLDRAYMFLELYQHSYDVSHRAQEISCFQKAARLNHNINAQVEAKTQLGLLALGGEFKGEPNFDEVLTLDHSNKFATMGALYGKAQIVKDKEEKQGLLESIMSYKPKYNSAYYSRACLDLAEIYGTNREYDKALKILQYPFKQQHDNDIKEDAIAIYNGLLEAQG